MITAYNVVSTDGFIARRDGSEDFIPDILWDDFIELCSRYGALVIGRKTYDAIQSYEPEAIESFEKSEIKIAVLSRDESFQPKKRYSKITSLHEVPTLHPDTLLSSWPILNSALLRGRLIDRIILVRLPISIGEGIGQFEAGLQPSLALIHQDESKDLSIYEVLY